MANVKNISTTDRNKVRSFGQNLVACASITGRSLESIAQNSGVAISFLKGTFEGKGELTKEILDAVANELDIRPLDLIGSHGDEARRTAYLTSLLESSSERVIVNLYEEPPIPRTSAPRIKPQSAVPAIAVAESSPQSLTQTAVTSTFPNRPIKAKPASTAGKNPSATKVPWPKPEVSKPATTPTPKAPPKEPKRVLKAQLEIPDIPTEESGGINWDKHGLVARLATGAVFDLTQKEVRLEIARRMRFLKGSLTFVELNKEAKLGKNGGWIGAIEGGGSTLHREDIEKLATFSKMSVVELLLGTGIVPLIARESASSWLERYKESMPDGDELSDFAHRLKGELAKWPRPIQNMIVNFLKETLE